MVEITAALVKELREKSGAGMMDCKMALSENDGSIDQSIDWLRAKGITKAAKKSDRIASEGLIGTLIEQGSATMVELNAETDFVARNEEFQSLLRDILQISLHNDNVESAQFKDTGRTVSEEINEKIATIGENIMLRRAVKYENIKDEHIFSYTHNSVADSLGKIGVLVAIKSKGNADHLTELGKGLCMHIAATNPLALSSSEISAELIEREKQIAIEQARDSGKPENIIEKMVEGRIKKFTEENALLSQIFVIDGETKISKLLETKSNELKDDILVTRFVRMQLGDGIEKKADDFASEVAAAVGKN